MSLIRGFKRFRQAGFSLIELMVGMTIGFIALAVIVQTMGAFEGQKRTTTAAVDAQENGLIAMMAIEADVRKAGSGFNHPVSFSCRNFFSYYQAVSGTGAPVAVSSFSTVPVLINDVGSRSDTINVRSGLRFTGSVPTQLVKPMVITAASTIELEVDRAYDFVGAPAVATDPPADVILVVSTEPDYLNCSLMQVSSKTGSVLTISNGAAGKTPEYNAPHAYMTANNWPGFGAGGVGYQTASRVFRVGSTTAGGVLNTAYSIDANNSLQAVVANSGAAATTDVLASEIVALQAQYGVSDPLLPPSSRVISSWVDGTGVTWGAAALTANTAGAIANRQRIKAVRIAVVARSSRRDGALVTNACTDPATSAILYYGPCSWDGGPAISLGSAADTEWQHYRYRVYQTVIPMRNVLWPDL